MDNLFYGFNTKERYHFLITFKGVVVLMNRRIEVLQEILSLNGYKSINDLEYKRC